MSSSIIMLLGVLFVGWYAFTQTDILASLKQGFSPSPPPPPVSSAAPVLPTIASQQTAKPSAKQEKAQPVQLSPRTQLLATAKSSGSCGQTIYKATGRTARTTDTGPAGQAIHYASSGKAASSRRLNANNTPFSAIEATIYFEFNGTSCGKPDPEMSIKLWGPTHSAGNCCWCIGVVTASGKVCFGGEGPHPSTTTCQKTLGNVGSLRGKTVGMKYIIWPGSGGAHQELYLDAGNGQWKFMGSREGSCGKDKTSTTVSKNQQVEFRIDCKNVTIKCASVNEIVPSSKSNFAYTGNMHYLESSPISLLYNSY